MSDAHRTGPRRWLVWERGRTGALTATLYHGELPRHDSEAARAIVHFYPVDPRHDALDLHDLRALPAYAAPAPPPEPPARHIDLRRERDV